MSGMRGISYPLLLLPKREKKEVRKGREGRLIRGRGGSDEYCPHCDNHFVIDAKTPQAALRVEGEDIRKDSRFVGSMVLWWWWRGLTVARGVGWLRMIASKGRGNAGYLDSAMLEILQTDWGEGELLFKRGRGGRGHFAFALYSGLSRRHIRSFTISQDIHLQSESD